MLCRMLAARASRFFHFRDLEFLHCLVVHVAKRTVLFFAAGCLEPPVLALLDPVERL